MRSIQIPIFTVIAVAFGLGGFTLAQHTCQTGQGGHRSCRGSADGNIQAHSGRGAERLGMIIKGQACHAREMQLSGMLELGFNYTMKLGSRRVAYPIMPQGFLPMLNDSFYLEGELALQYHWYSVGFASASFGNIQPLVGGRWNFYLTPDWTVFSAMKIGFNVGLANNVGASFAWEWTAGAFWNFSKSMALRMEFGPTANSWGGGERRGAILRAGITLPM